MMKQSIFLTAIFVFLGACSDGGSSGSGKDPFNPFFGDPNYNPNDSIREGSGLEIVPIEAEDGEHFYEFFQFEEIPNRYARCRYAYSEFDVEGQGHFVVSRTFDDLTFYMGDGLHAEFFSRVSLSFNENALEPDYFESLPVVFENANQLRAEDRAFYNVETSSFEESYDLNIEFHNMNHLGHLNRLIQRDGVETESFRTFLRGCERI